MAEPYTKCGRRGDTVWQRNRYGQIHYPYHAPANPRSPAQQVVRGNWKMASTNWRVLAEPQRQSWCRDAQDQKSRRRLGKRLRLKGYYYYMRINVKLLNRGQPMMDLPPGDPPPAALSFPLMVSQLARQLQQSLAVSAQPVVQPAGLAPSGTG
jgi:hypothetical protein